MTPANAERPTEKQKHGHAVAERHQSDCSRSTPLARVISNHFSCSSEAADADLAQDAPPPLRAALHPRR